MFCHFPRAVKCSQKPVTTKNTHTKPQLSRVLDPKRQALVFPLHLLNTPMFNSSKGSSG